MTILFNINQCDQVPATLELDDMQVNIQDIIDGKTGAVLTSPGPMYIDSDFIDLSRNPDALGTEFSGDEPSITFFSPRASIVLSGYFKAENAMNLTFISPYGVFVSNANFENFARVELISEGGAVILRNVTGYNFLVNSTISISRDNMSAGNVDIIGNQYLQYNNFTAHNLNLNIANTYLCDHVASTNLILNQIDNIVYIGANAEVTVAGSVVVNNNKLFELQGSIVADQFNLSSYSINFYGNLTASSIAISPTDPSSTASFAGGIVASYGAKIEDFNSIQITDPANFYTTSSYTVSLKANSISLLSNLNLKTDGLISFTAQNLDSALIENGITINVQTGDIALFPSYMNYVPSIISGSGLSIVVDLSIPSLVTSTFTKLIGKSVLLSSNIIINNGVIYGKEIITFEISDYIENVNTIESAGALECKATKKGNLFFKNKNNIQIKDLLFSSKNGIEAFFTINNFAGEILISNSLTGSVQKIENLAKAVYGDGRQDRRAHNHCHFYLDIQTITESKTAKFWVGNNTMLNDLSLYNVGSILYLKGANISGDKIQNEDVTQKFSGNAYSEGRSTCVSDLPWHKGGGCKQHGVVDKHRGEGQCRDFAREHGIELYFHVEGGGHLAHINVARIILAGKISFSDSEVSFNQVALGATYNDLIDYNSAALVAFQEQSHLVSNFGIFEHGSQILQNIMRSSTPLTSFGIRLANNLFDLMGLPQFTIQQDNMLSIAGPNPVLNLVTSEAIVAFDCSFYHSLTELGVPTEQISLLLADEKSAAYLLRSAAVNSLGRIFVAVENPEQDLCSLLNNGLAAKEAYGFTVGKPLTPYQNDLLSSPILWFVKNEYNIWEPYLYLDTDTAKGIRKDVSLVLDNSEMSVQGDFVSINENIFIEGDSKITGEGNFVLLGGGIDGSGGATLEVTAKNIAIIQASALGHSSIGTFTSLGDQVTITNIALALRAYNVIGIKSGYINVDKLVLDAGDYIVIIPTYIYEEFKIEGRYSKHYELHINARISELISCGDIVIKAKNDVTSVGSTVTSVEGNVHLASKEGEIYALPAALFDKIERTDIDEGLMKTSTHYSLKEETGFIPTIVNALKGLIDLSSAGDTNLIAARFSAKQVSMKALDAGSFINLLPYNAYVIKAENTFTKRYYISFSDGKINYAMIKSSAHASYDESTHPTIIQAGDQFIGYAADGSWYQLASSVQGTTVTLTAPRGVTLAASSEFHTSLNIIGEKGVGIGFQCDKEAIAIKASAEISSIRTTDEEVLARTSMIVSEYFTVNTNETFRIEGASITATKGFNVTAKIEVHDVVYNTYSHQTRQMDLEFGGKIALGIGSIGKLASSGQELSQSKVDSTEDKINTVFALYDAYNTMNRAALFLATPGLGLGAWLYMKYQKSTDTVEIITAKPTEILAGTYHSVTEELKFVATQLLAYDAYFNTDKFIAESAKSTLLRKSQYWGGEGIIPVGGAVVGGASGFYGKLKQDEQVHFHADIQCGKLELKVKGHANIRGAYIYAKDLHAVFNSLTLESLQDVMTRDGYNVGLGVGSEGLNSISAGLDDAKSNVVKKVTSLVGSEKAVIVVAGMMEMIGSITANAERNPDGSFTDAGALQLTVGELFVRHIYDYDNGKMFQAAMSLTSSSAEAKAEGENNPYRSEYHATAAAHFGEGYTRATIGKGTVTLGKGELPADVNRDLDQVQDFHWEYQLDPIKMHFYDVEQKKLDKLHQSMKSGEWVDQVERNFGTMPHLIKEFARSGFTLSQEELVALQQEYWAPDYISYAQKLREEEAQQKLNNEERQILEKFTAEQDAIADTYYSDNGHQCVFAKDKASELLPHEYQTLINKMEQESGLLHGQLSSAAIKIKQLAQSYADFAKEYPNLARYGLSATVILVKTIAGTVAGAMAGSLPGAIAGGASSGVTAFAMETKSEIVGEILEKPINAALKWLAEKGAPELMSMDSTLSTEDAEIIIKLSALALSSAKDLADGLKFLSHSLKPKFAMAGVGDVDFDSYSGTKGNVDEIALFAKQYPPSAQKVGGRHTLNGDKAGSYYKFDDLPESIKVKYPHLETKYPNGVWYDEQGFPDFSQHATHTVKVSEFVGYETDFKNANKLAGLTTEPKGYTWHHHQDKQTMQLIPKDLHDAFKHNGGMATTKHGLNKK